MASRQVLKDTEYPRVDMALVDALQVLIDADDLTLEGVIKSAPAFTPASEAALIRVSFRAGKQFLVDKLRSLAQREAERNVNHRNVKMPN